MDLTNDLVEQMGGCYLNKLAFFLIVCTGSLKKENKHKDKVNAIHKRVRREGGLIVKPYEINNMIIDDEFDGEEFVTADFTHQNKKYSITFQKADLEIMNTWVFENGTSLPANLSDHMIELLREDVKKRI